MRTRSSEENGRRRSKRLVKLKDENVGKKIVGFGEGKRKREISVRNEGKDGNAGGKIVEISERKCERRFSGRSKGKDENVMKRRKKTSKPKFVGEPIDRAEAMRRWPHRYELNKSKGKNSGFLNQNKAGDSKEREMEEAVVAHYSMADVDGIIYELGDCVHVNSDCGPNHIGRILELFEIGNQQRWFSVEWFYHLSDTAVGQYETKGHDKRRIFLSTMKDDNLLECIASKLKVIQVSALTSFIGKLASIPRCDYHYDMGYDYLCSSFYSLDGSTNIGLESSDSSSTANNSAPNLLCYTDVNMNPKMGRSGIVDSEMSVLDLYSGCGAMSTGLCMGATLSGVKFVTRWAVDLNPYACESMKYNHPETEVRNEAAEDFLRLIKEWKKLCEKYLDSRDFRELITIEHKIHNICKDRDDGNSLKEDDDELEVEKIVGIRCVDPCLSNKSGLEFKVHWKGYGEEEDTWEPYEGLKQCEECVKDFVDLGRKKKILPLPGDVDIICGGPPCQGASGLNRFRNVDAPLDDPRNHQIVVFMDIVDFLRPRFVLMENVVDILKFVGGILGRYALGRLVNMHYQARLGMLVAGCYGLPQFRMRVFIWGASPQEKLPQYPLPTHDVIVKGSFPVSWEHNAVAYDETHKPQLFEALVLADAISDLPPVKNSEDRDEMQYNRSHSTDFQYLMRIPKEVFPGGGSTDKKCSMQMLFDHRPYKLNKDDFDRARRIPKRKGANFRDLKGVIVRPDNTVELDLKNRAMLPSGKPLVPDYALTLHRGRSSKPFGRIWWDEIVSTVVTQPEPRFQRILHPYQDRVLTIRELARIQGFPDYYKLFGPVLERYVQVGNAVAIPVTKALGYELGLAIQKKCGCSAMVKLPQNFIKKLVAPKKGKQVKYIGHPGAML